MVRIQFATIALMSCAFLQTAGAHYLWLNIDQKAGDNGTVNLYFEEGPRAGDGRYLDPFIAHGKTWVRTAADPKPLAVDLAEVKESGKRWLAAELTKPAPRAVEHYAKWGVYRYGQTDVLLHYNARRIDVTSAEQLAPLARAEHLQLDIVPRIAGDTLEVQVLWKGKPAASRTVYFRGPGVNKTLKTDEKGTASLKPGKPGQYTLRTNVEEPDRSGTDDGKEYQKVRHHCTLTINLPLTTPGSD